jgi:hypothetical protein
MIKFGKSQYIEPGKFHEWAEKNGWLHIATFYRLEGIPDEEWISPTGIACQVTEIPNSKDEKLVMIECGVK